MAAMSDENKKKALDAAIAKLEKDFGKGTVMKLGGIARKRHRCCRGRLSGRTSVM